VANCDHLIKFIFIIQSFVLIKFVVKCFIFSLICTGNVVSFLR
jgi:vacuolar-type H+-ATPase subunit I/STV1